MRTWETPYSLILLALSASRIGAEPWGLFIRRGPGSSRSAGIGAQKSASRIGGNRKSIIHRNPVMPVVMIMQGSQTRGQRRV